MARLASPPGSLAGGNGSSPDREVSNRRHVGTLAPWLVEVNRRLGLTLIVTSHHLASSLRMADRLVFLVDGHAVSGAAAEILESRDPRVVEFLEAEGDGRAGQAEARSANPGGPA